MCKNPTKNILRRWLSNDFYLILVYYVAHTAKYLTYLLKSIEVIQVWEFDNLHMTQCAKIIVGFMANVGNVFYPTFTNDFFLIFSTFFTFFLFSSQRLLHLWPIGLLCSNVLKHLRLIWCRVVMYRDFSVPIGMMDNEVIKIKQQRIK